jgi:hypothetical protein
MASQPMTREERLPVAILTEHDILKAAAKALRRHEKLKQEMRDSETAIRRLCRQYDLASGARGFAPHHLAQACKARGLL